MSEWQNLIARLEIAFATASNDDLSKPGTVERKRHCQRIEAILDARDALQASVFEHDGNGYQVRKVGEA